MSKITEMSNELDSLDKKLGELKSHCGKVMAEIDLKIEDLQYELETAIEKRDWMLVMKVSSKLRELSMSF